MNFETGYTWREGAPADQVPVYAELGYPLPWWGLAAKGAITYVRSLGNDSPRQPDDRFGSSATTTSTTPAWSRPASGGDRPPERGAASTSRPATTSGSGGSRRGGTASRSLSLGLGALSAVFGDIAF